TVIGQGPMGLERTLPPEGDGVRRGVARFVGSPSYASCPYTAEYDAQLAGKALAPYAAGTIGWVGRGGMSFAFGEPLQRSLTRAKFVDASDWVDAIKAVKSDEELELIRRTAAMQDACMEATFRHIHAGMRDLEIAAIAEQIGHKFGS